MNESLDNGSISNDKGLPTALWSNSAVREVEFG